MKKILLGGIAVTMCFALTACGTSQSDATLTRLGNQLDETANTISSIQTINPSDISLSKETLEKISITENPLPHFFNSRAAKTALLNEQYYKADILSKTSSIKNNLSKDLKLSKAQISAIKELTESLGKYTNSISYSKNEMENAAKSISSLKKNAEKNSPKINAKLNRLACNSNARSAYFENLLSALSEIESYVCPDCDNNYSLYVKTPTQQTTEEHYSFYIKSPSQNNSDSDNSAEQTENIKENNSTIKNIDTYLSSDLNSTNNTDNTDCEDCQNCPQCQTSIHPMQHTNLYANPYHSNTPYKWDQTFNQTRNTDTYGPTLRNIDTYNPNIVWRANGLYGANGLYDANGLYGANGFYGNTNFYGNGMYGTYPAFYGNKRFYPQGLATPYYNSNTINRLTYPQAQPFIFANAEVEELSKENIKKIENTPKTLEYIAEDGENSIVVEVSNTSSETTTQNVTENHDNEVMPLPEPPIKSTNTTNLKNNKNIDQNNTNNRQKDAPKIRKIDDRKAETDEIDQVVVAHKKEHSLCVFDINSKIAKLMK